MRNKALIFLNLAGIMPRSVEKVIAAGTDLTGFSNFSEGDWKALGLSRDEAAAVLKAKASGALDKELALIEKNKITVLSLFDRDYPALLKDTVGAPPVLYIRGNAAVLSEFSLAIVGSRQCTDYGMNFACELGRKLATVGTVVVSGLARGIDTSAHLGALCGKTVAVLGSGLLNVYPPENRRLAGLIGERGAVVSEFPLETAPNKENFPRRNRVISGLSKGVVVVEAAARSGALITARFALEQNREVFAVPGRAGSFTSEGTNRLIQEGAKLIETVEDILMEFNLTIESVNHG